MSDSAAPVDTYSPARDAGFAWAVTIVFAAVTAFNLSRHEMWRDELVMWLIVRDTESIAAMFDVLAYGGHPPLWFLALRPLSAITRDPVAMQLLQLVLATASAFVFACYAPFSRLLKGLFLLGYFPLYEYGVKSRSYALGMLLLFSACALFPRRHRRLVALALLAFAMCQTSVHAMICAIALSASLVVERALGWAEEIAPPGRTLAAAAISVLGVVAAVAVIRPATDAAFDTGWQLGWNAPRALEAVSALRLAFLPGIGDMLFRPPPSAADAVLGLACLAAAVWLLRKGRSALVFYALATGGLLAFFYLRYGGHVWHHGQLYLAFVSALWIARTRRGAPTPRRLENGLLLALLLIHSTTGIRAVLRDGSHAYSAGKATARFIRDEGLDRLLLVGDPDTEVVSVAGYLDTPIFYPRADRFGSYYVYDRARRTQMNPASVLLRARRLVREHDRDALLILNYPLAPSQSLPAAALAASGATPVAEFTDSLWQDERYYLYRLPSGPGLAEPLDSRLGRRKGSP